MRPAPLSVEIEAPDISAYRAGNTGIDYVTTLDSHRPGPHAMVSAVVHGNELCGAIVLDWLHRIGFCPLRGRLSLAFVNVDAFLAFDPFDPMASRYIDEDFNRLWSEDVLDGPRSSRELARARELRPLLEQVDVLLDLHSMTACPIPLMLCGPERRGRELALRLGAPEHVVADEGHAAGKRMRDYAPFIDASSRRASLLMECGLHWARETVDVARDVTARFLADLGMADADFAREHACAAPQRQRVIEVTGPVTIESDAFRFVVPYRGMEVIAHEGTVIGYDGDRPILTPYDECVLIMPSTHKRRGESAVRLGRFVS